MDEPRTVAVLRESIGGTGAEPDGGEGGSKTMSAASRQKSRFLVRQSQVASVEPYGVIVLPIAMFVRDVRSEQSCGGTGGGGDGGGGDGGGGSGGGGEGGGGQPNGLGSRLQVPSWFVHIWIMPSVPGLTP